jgi:hypothetical protein
MTYATRVEYSWRPVGKTSNVVVLNGSVDGEAMLGVFDGEKGTATLNIGGYSTHLEIQKWGVDAIPRTVTLIVAEAICQCIDHNRETADGC